MAQAPFSRQLLKSRERIGHQEKKRLLGLIRGLLELVFQAGTICTSRNKAGASSGGKRIADEVVAVGPLAFQSDEQSARLDAAGIDSDALQLATQMRDEKGILDYVLVDKMKHVGDGRPNYRRNVQDH
jgi:hypothetical protein